MHREAGEPRCVAQSVIVIRFDSATRAARLLLTGRGLRALVDGYVAVLLPAYLLALGFGSLQVGLLSTATLLGSALATLAIGRWGHRWRSRTLLLGAALLMAATGLAFAGLSSFWPLLLVAFVGTLNPSSGDVSVFLALEHANLAQAAEGSARTSVFARYSVIGATLGALGALAAAAPEAAAGVGIGRVAAMRALFVLYGAVGLLVFGLYRRLPDPAPGPDTQPAAGLGPSRGLVLKLAGLFSVDAFAGGMAVQSLLALWLYQRFGLSLTAAGSFFFWAGVLTALSQLLAPRVAGRIGLLNTMVYTHIPSSLALIAAAFASNTTAALGFLLLRAALSQMDVPTRTAYVMSAVTPPERTAAASYTAVPRSLAASLSPSLSGALMAGGWLAAPLVACGLLKIAYDLALLRTFRGVRLR